MNSNDFILKSITLSMDKFANFLCMSNENAGEFIKSLLQYAMDGTRPNISDPWKQSMYNMYEATITEQMAALRQKRDKASKQAKEREKTKKEALKLLKGEKAKAKVASVQEVAVDVIPTDVISDTDTTVEAEANDTTDVVVGADDTSSPEVISEDLSFSHFVTILGKRDSNVKYDRAAEDRWKQMSDDSKRKALAWVANYVVTNPGMNSRQFPYALVNSRPWNA